MLEGGKKEGDEWNGLISVNGVFLGEGAHSGAHGWFGRYKYGIVQFS